MSGPSVLRGITGSPAIRRRKQLRRFGESDGEGSHGMERWLLTYSDMITLLLVLFIVFFSVSKIDEGKLRAVERSVSNGLLNKQSTGTSTANLAKSSASTSSSTASTASTPAAQLATIESELESALSAKGLVHDVTFRITPAGLTEGLVADSTFFVTGSATLSTVGEEVVDASARVLAGYPNAVDVAGYTDDEPIHSSLFSSNWALSAARATTVVERMTEVDGVDPTHVVILGFGQYHPEVPNNSSQHRAMNRRVNIVVAPETADGQSVSPK